MILLKMILVLFLLYFVSSDISTMSVKDLKFYLCFDVDNCKRNSTLNLTVSNGEDVCKSSYNTSGYKIVTLHGSGCLQFIWNISSMNCCWSVSNIEIYGGLPDHYLCPVNYRNCNVNKIEYRCCYDYNDNNKPVSPNDAYPFLKPCSPVSSNIHPSTTNNGKHIVTGSITWIITSTPASRSATTDLITSSFMVSTTPSPLLKCLKEGGWPETIGGENATGVYCYRGCVNGTRRCNNQTFAWDKEYCFTSSTFTSIWSEITHSPKRALEKFVDSQENETITFAESFVIFDSIINKSNQSFTTNVSKLVLDATNNMMASDNIPDDVVKRRSMWSQLLLTLDTFALNLQDSNKTLFRENIALDVKEIKNTTGPIKVFFRTGNSITLPVELFDSLPVTVASFCYMNISKLLPPHNNSQKLLSNCLSSTVNIDYSQNGFSQPVNITFNISGQQILMSDTLNCVFWNFEFSVDDTTLPTGQWNTSGCKIVRQDSELVTCQCDHLTHFAILLSPGVPISNKNYERLNLIGYVLVPISLVCLLLTILTYTCMRSLWSMRNYIHVMLCINLFAGQLVFIVGSAQTNNWSICSGIAVLLQYLFLVTFMWMLMEGVVLYVVLVRIFIKHPKRYIAGFTLTSYGVPGLYMIIIVPIGFLAGTSDIKGHTHYLYFQDEQLITCWLNYESGFIWTFIAPVVLILLTNIVFFIMAITIIQRHKKRERQKTEVANIKKWLKASISLTVIMGLAWLANTIFFSDKLIFVAYVMDIFISCQGLLIFILFVPLSKHVREAYLTWLRKKLTNYKLPSCFFSTKSSLQTSGAASVKQTKSTSTSNTSSEQSTCAILDESVIVNSIMKQVPDEEPNITELYTEDN